MTKIHDKLMKKYNHSQPQTTQPNPFSQTETIQQQNTYTPVTQSQNDIIEPNQEILERFQAYNTEDDSVQFNTTHFPHQSIFKTINAPIGAFIKPLGKHEVTIVDLLSNARQANQRIDLPRCSTCRAYVNPFFTFLDYGKKMKCNLCSTVDLVPEYYVKELDQYGYVKNFENSPELVSGSIEFLVNEDYTARPPKEPTYFFLIDISKSSCNNNIPYYSLHAIKSCLQGLRFNGEKSCSIGIGFFDGRIHLCDLKKNKPQLITIDPNVDKQNQLPLEKFLVYLEYFDEEQLCAKLDMLYDNILFSDNEVAFHEISQALKYTNEILSSQGGRIFMVLGTEQAYNPTIDSKDKTNRHFFYSNQFDFTKLGVELNKNMVSLDLYCFGHGVTKNLASMAENIRLGGGNLFYYQDSSQTNLHKFFNEMVHSITKLVTWEAVFRIRCSKGWKKTSYGNYYSSTYNDLLRIQHVDNNYSVLYQFEPLEQQDIKQLDSSYFFIQTSLLYTNTQRQRLIRIHNYVLPISNNVRTIYQSLSYQVTLALIFKQQMVNIISRTPLTDLQIELINDLKKYFTGTTLNTSDEFQINTLPYIALGFLGILKNIIFQGQYINNFKNDSVDLLTFYRLVLNSADYYMIFKNINSSLYDCSNMTETIYHDEDEDLVYPPAMRLALEEVEQVKLCLLDDGFSLFFYIIDQDYVNQIGIFEGGYSEDDISDNEYGQKLKLLINDIREQNCQRYVHLYVVKPDEENYFLSIHSKLIEEKGSGFGFTNSYYEFYQTYIRGISKCFQIIHQNSQVNQNLYINLNKINLHHLLPTFFPLYLVQVAIQHVTIQLYLNHFLRKIFRNYFKERKYFYMIHKILDISA